MDQKSKARMAAILLATAFRRFGDAVDPMTTRIADWHSKGVVGVLSQEDGGITLFKQEEKSMYDPDGKAVFVGMLEDNVLLISGEKVPVIFGFDYLHKLLIVLNLDRTLELTYIAYMGGIVQDS